MDIVEFLFPSALLSIEALILFFWLIVGRHFLIHIMDKEMQTPEMLELRVFKMDTPPGQLERETKHAWLGAMSIGTLFYLAIIFGLFVPAESSILNTLTTFVVMFLWVEVSYYFLHKAMHDFQWFYAAHREHHTSVIPTAHSTTAASFAEEWIVTALPWVLFAAGASWFMEISYSGLILYFLLNYFISVGGHINTENSPVSLTFAKVGLASPTDHSLHHARFKVNYGFSVSWFDKMFGTYSDETEDLRLRALAGNGNTNLKRPIKKKVEAQDEQVEESAA